MVAEKIFYMKFSICMHLQNNEKLILKKLEIPNSVKYSESGQNKP